MLESPAEKHVSRLMVDAMLVASLLRGWVLTIVITTWIQNWIVLKV